LRNPPADAHRLLPSQFDLLEMDRLERPLVNLPLLLDPSSYVPDTVDLTDDALARKYWLTCFEEALDGVVKRAVASQPGSVDAAERAEKFRQKYWSKLQTLRHQPFAYGTLTVRSLLDTREHCLNEFNFPDPYSKVSAAFLRWAGACEGCTSSREQGCGLGWPLAQQRLLRSPGLEASPVSGLAGSAYSLRVAVGGRQSCPRGRQASRSPAAGREVPPSSSGRSAREAVCPGLVARAQSQRRTPLPASPGLGRSVWGWGAGRL